MLHIADYNDSRQWIYAKAKESVGEGEVTEPEYYLDGVRVYHQMPAPEPKEEENDEKKDPEPQTGESLTVLPEGETETKEEGVDPSAPSDMPDVVSPQNEGDEGDAGFVLEDFDLPFIDT